MRHRGAVLVAAALGACGKSPRTSGAGAACPEDMARVPAATFTMGAPDGEMGEDIERPRHQVTISRDYCVDRTEVTVERYLACTSAGKCPPLDRMPGCTTAAQPTHPINCIEWESAKAYCKWAGKRLLTEAEWELAARGTDGRLYPWGDAPPAATLLNGCGDECGPDPSKNRPATFAGSDGFATTAPVGSFPAGASPYGLLDMAGNVSEWVSDWKGEYAADAVTDPRGPSSSENGKIIRGGDFAVGGPDNATATGRYWYSFGTDAIGVRCGRTL